MSVDRESLAEIRAKDRRFVVGALAGALFLVPVLMVGAYAFFALVFSSANAGMDRDTRMEGAPALTAAERELLAATHFDLAVAVTSSNGQPGESQWLRTRDALIRELDGFGLFDAVAAVGVVPESDLIVVARDGPFGNRTGTSFTLALMDDPENEVEVRVNYYVAPMWSGEGDRQQYLDRVAVETINAVKQLQADAPP